jgi:hypothetical protein
MATKRSAGQPTGQLRQFLRTAKRLHAGSDYGLGLVGAGECGDVVLGIDRKRCHSSISCAVNPRHHMDHSYPLEKQGNSDLNRREAKFWRWSASVAAN